MKSKSVLWALVLLVALGGVVFWFKQSNPAQNMQGSQFPATEVSVVTVTPKPVTFSKDLPGRTSAFRVAEIRPQVSGIIVKRLFEEGSDVKEGQQLYQIDPVTYQAAYNSAKAALLKAEANVKSVRAKAARYTELVKSGAVSRQEYDDVTASLAQGSADVEIAKAAVETAKIRLDYTKVFSPISGRIGQSQVTEGALVTENQAQPLATVQQFDRIYVDVTQSGEELMLLREQYANDGQAGGKPTAQLLVNSKPYGREGTLQFSDVSVNPSTGSVKVRILFPNPDLAILPGLFVHARLVQSKDSAAILVPQQSILRHADGVVTVWTVDDENKATIRPVKISRVYRDQWQVTQGLNAGDRVVVEGVMKIQPGSVVKPVEREGTVATGSDDPSDGRGARPENIGSATGEAGVASPS